MNTVHTNLRHVLNSYDFPECRRCKKPPDRSKVWDEETTSEIVMSVRCHGVTETRRIAVSDDYQKILNHFHRWFRAPLVPKWNLNFARGMRRREARL